MIKTSSVEYFMDFRQKLGDKADAFRIVPKSDKGTVIYSSAAADDKEIQSVIDSQISEAQKRIEDELTKTLESTAATVLTIAAEQAKKEESERADAEKRVKEIRTTQPEKKVDVSGPAGDVFDKIDG